MRAVNGIAGAVFGAAAGGVGGALGSSVLAGLLAGSIGGFAVGVLYSLKRRSVMDPLIAVGSWAPAGFVGGAVGSVAAHAGWKDGALSCAVGWGLGLILPALASTAGKRRAAGTEGARDPAEGRASTAALGAGEKDQLTNPSKRETLRELLKNEHYPAGAGPFLDRESLGFAETASRESLPGSARSKEFYDEDEGDRPTDDEQK